MASLRDRLLPLFSRAAFPRRHPRQPRRPLCACPSRPLLSRPAGRSSIPLRRALSSGSTVKLSLKEVREISIRALTKSGLERGEAGIIADVITAAERDGCASHGLFRLPGYCRTIREDGPFPAPVVEEERGVVRVDAKGGIAALAFEAGRQKLVSKSESNGIAACSLRNIRHFSALWFEVEKLASEHGLVALAFVNSKAFVSHAGGSKRTYGTNPMAFAFPRYGKPPLVWDQASSLMARGEIQIAYRDGHPLPDGVGVREDGTPTLDAQEVLRGAQSTFGGHKGTAIALMVELLAAVVTGSPLAVELVDEPETKPTVNGELIIALKPEQISGQEMALLSLRAESLFEHILDDPTGGTRLPGERRLRNRKLAAENGIDVCEPLLRDIEEEFR